jgi:hypothetical protein
MNKNIKSYIGLAMAVAFAVTVACSGSGSGFGNPSINPAGSGSIMDNVKSNLNCTWSGDITTNNESGCVWGKDGGKPVEPKQEKHAQNQFLA